MKELFLLFTLNYLLLPIIIFAEQTCIIETFPGKETGKIQTLKGHIYFGFEQSTFKACGHDKSWWFGTADESLYKSLREIFFSQENKQDRKPLFITGKGCVSGEGKYGHMGMSERSVVLSELKQQRLKSANDCEISD